MNGAQTSRVGESCWSPVSVGFVGANRLQKDFKSAARRRAKSLTDGGPMLIAAFNKPRDQRLFASFASEEALRANERVKDAKSLDIVICEDRVQVELEISRFSGCIELNQSPARATEYETEWHPRCSQHALHLPLRTSAKRTGHIAVIRRLPERKFLDQKSVFALCVWEHARPHVLGFDVNRDRGKPCAIESELFQDWRVEPPMRIAALCAYGHIDIDDPVPETPYLLIDLICLLSRRQCPSRKERLEGRVREVHVGNETADIFDAQRCLVRDL